MNFKDAAIGLSTWLLVIGFIFLISSLGSWPLWSVAILALLAWMAFVLLAIRDHEREKRQLKNPVMWMIHTDRRGEKVWISMDGKGRTRPLEDMPKNEPTFDEKGVEI